MTDQNINGTSADKDDDINAFLREVRQSGVLAGSGTTKTEDKPAEKPADRGPDSGAVKSDIVLFSNADDKTTVFNKASGTKPKETPAKAARESKPQEKSAAPKNSNAKKAEQKKKAEQIKANRSGSDDAGGNKKKNRKKKNGRSPWWAVLLRIILYLFCFFLICGCVLALVVTMYLGKVTGEDEDLLDLNQIKLSYATVILYNDLETGEVVELDRIYQNENRIWTNFEEFPEHLIDAVVASEDQRFWDHKGVDIKRTTAAFLNLALQEVGLPSLWSNAQGGSTLTQQLVKNITQEKEAAGFDGILRKIREIYRAYQLEKRFTKDQILEAYLNTFNVGSQVAGIEAGANYYFGKTTKELTTAESAAIVCITKYPLLYDPFIDPEQNKYQRENVVLWLMNQQGLLTESEYQAALEESAGFVFDEPHSYSATNIGYISSWFTDYVIDSVLKDLVDIAGYTQEEASDLLWNGGLRIYTTYNPKIQAAVEAAAYNMDIWPDLELIEEGDDEAGENGENIGEPKANQIQGAIVVMDYQGQVLGLAGGIREKTESRGLNRAYDSFRQTGSAMKPIGAYAPAIEYNNNVTFSTLFADAPSEVINGSEWPRNYDWTYGNPVTVYEGIYRSLNTTAVFTLKMIGYEVAYDFVRTNLGVTSLTEDDRALGPMALGSLSIGISPVELCAAYAVFGNDGTYNEPHCYTLVLNTRDETVIDKTKSIARNKAISPQTALIMNRLLQGVMRVGTGTNARPSGQDLPYAGKSGTTSDNKDFWFVGFNPYYLCTVWEGYDQPEYMRRPSVHHTQRAFKQIMTEICADLEYKDFPSDVEGIVTAAFCLDSGDLAGPGCGRTMRGYYKAGTAPATVCDPAQHPAPVVQP